MSYSDLLRDPQWQKKRLEVMNAAGWKCVTCGSTTKTLNVHHVQYVRGRMPWEYDLSELRCLCEDCHKAEHGLGEPVKPLRKRTKLDDAKARGGSAEREVVRMALHRPEHIKAALALFQYDEPTYPPLREIFDAIRLKAPFFYETGEPCEREDMEACVINAADWPESPALLRELYDDTDGLDHAADTLAGAATVLKERRLLLRSAAIDAELPTAPDERKDELTREKMDLFRQLREMQSGWWKRFR